MPLPLPENDVRQAFIAACLGEVRALKPGNVHIHAAGHNMEVRQFEASAHAAAPFIADPALPVGRRVRQGVDASFAAAGCNTNLGILLLCAPLAAAAGASPSFFQGAPPLEPGTEETSRRGASSILRGRLTHVLEALTVEDAQQAFQAIARASPGGLGKAPEQDVSAPPTVTLKAAMALAASRDRIARAYVTAFAEVFCFGLPLLEEARRRAARPDLAVTTLHMAFLAREPDSHICRKYGEEKAREAQNEAKRLAGLFLPVATPGAFPALLALDQALKARSLNPGTTADFVAATLFAEGLAEKIVSAMQC